MNLIHILNYSIPIGFILLAGFLLDKMCKPAGSDGKGGNGEE